MSTSKPGSFRQTLKTWCIGEHRYRLRIHKTDTGRRGALVSTNQVGTLQKDTDGRGALVSTGKTWAPTDRRGALASTYQIGTLQADTIDKHRNRFKPIQTDTEDVVH